MGDYTYQFQNNYHGFLYSAGNYSDLPVFGSGVSQAFGINKSGQIVGLYEDQANKVHGYLKDKDNISTLDVPSGFDAFGTEATGINDASQIVGNYSDRLGRDGFLDSGGVFTTIDFPGSNYTAVGGINNAGVIVGVYQDANGNFHGFLATAVPEPSTLLLLGTGALGVMGWACRWHVRSHSRPGTPLTAIP